ncbi:MAG: 50S ribosomal protein P1 [Candidatus Woesearchaeota archaeon]|jgi:large subunit ribosomal protein L12
MEYIYAAMILHKAGKKITEDAVKKILHAAEVQVNEAKVKALVAALDGVNIEEAIKKQAVAAAPVAAPAAQVAPKVEAKKEEKKVDNAGAAGLGALFG